MRYHQQSPPRVSAGRMDQRTERVYQSPQIYFRWMYFVPWIHRCGQEHATLTHMEVGA